MNAMAKGRSRNLLRCNQSGAKEIGQPPLGGAAQPAGIASTSMRGSRLNVTTSARLGANADCQAVGRQYPEGSAGPGTDRTGGTVVFNKPTYGLDLQNTQRARERIVEGAARGVAMIVISNELDELAAVSDRIAG